MRYKFTARIIGVQVPVHPKGFYYQGKFIILVGDVEKGHTIRRKEYIDHVYMKVEEDKNE